jgi:hypothetical protein
MRNNIDHSTSATQNIQHRGARRIQPDPLDHEIGFRCAGREYQPEDRGGNIPRNVGVDRAEPQAAVH